MPRYKMIGGENVPFTPEEEAQRDAEEFNHAAAQPLIRWQREMREASATMPDWLEDHINQAHGGIAGGAQQAAYNNKRDIRGNKP